MIITLILTALGTMLSAMFSWLPTATIASIPVIGSTMNSVLVAAIQSWNTFMETLPYAQISWQVFIYAIVPFELALLTLKIFLGSRTPSQHN